MYSTNNRKNTIPKIPAININIRIYQRTDAFEYGSIDSDRALAEINKYIRRTIHTH